MTLFDLITDVYTFFTGNGIIMDAASVMRGFEYYWKHWNVVDQWRRRHHTACEVTHNTIKKMKMETNYHETTVKYIYNSFHLIKLQNVYYK